MSEFAVSAAGAAAIAASFSQAFSRWGIALTKEAVEEGEPSVIRQGGWTISYIFGSDDEEPFLEYYATHRMTNDRRTRIYESGKTEPLDAIWEFAAWDPKKPGDEERAKREYREHNTRIAEELKELGLYPTDDINAFLRTEGMPEDG